MKRKILLGLVVLITLFTLTGCGNKKEENNKENTKDSKNIVIINKEKFELTSETELYDLHYNENYVDFHTDRVGDYKLMSYQIGDDLVFEVRLMYDDSRSDSELKAIIETQTGAKEQSKEVNGIKYIYYEYTGTDNETVHHYLYVHNGKVYTIAFFLGKEPGNIEEVFMNNVSFK